jgi:hypothetical protein
MVASGLPEGTIYSLVAWPVTQKGPSEILRGVTLNGSGVAVCAGSAGKCGTAEKPDDPIDIKLQPVAGEPVRLGLISADGTTRVFGKLTPVRLEGGDGGCGVEATLLTPAGELVLIEGSGFPANQEVTMDSDSGNERHSGKGKADNEGRYATALLPFRQGAAGGVTKVRLKAGGCSPAVLVPWGRK